MKSEQLKKEFMEIYKLGKHTIGNSTDTTIEFIPNERAYIKLTALIEAVIAERMPTEVLKMFFNELVHAGRDMAIRDRLKLTYLSEDMYFKDFETRFRSRMEGESK